MDTIKLFTWIAALFIGAAVAAPPYKTGSNMNHDNATKSILIKGIAKYKPESSTMVLSLSIEGEPGIMPGAVAGSSATPTTGTATSSAATGGKGPTTSPTAATTTGRTSASTPTGGSTISSTSESTGTSTPTGTGGSATSAATSAATTAVPGGGGSDFENEALEAHNKFRKVHGVPMMKLNAEMSKQAQAWADKIAAEGDGSHDPSISVKFGENWNIGCQEDQKSATATVTRWYNEVCDPGYTFGAEPSSLNAGHFTQVVWKSSVQLGYGKAEGTYMGAKCMFHVGRYKKAGNYGGKYVENVPKGKFNKQSYCDSIKKKSKRKRNEMAHLKRNKA